ncbi:MULTISPECIES: DUF6502 family protein [Pseudomonas]|jgi:hypothetical protein|uniref:DUF6502 family protein n=1 Tax=Pseudomonas monachiensis TaxID=3060212 RepID=A0ABW9HFE6_9PSED|nr:MULTISPECIES: DUF6502 family protein [unclassified Pseudomonas]KRB03715.1 hypothetical protein ASD91_24550 [Pseudomonas sp. Root68]KRB71091.1 hypothetical protein ASD95_22785 [Pseudomonas sp. Root71]
MQSSTLPTSLLKALRHVMQPLVRLMLRKGVTYLVFADLLKEVFVEVADREFRLGEKAPSDSRISLLTGVHRKDVRRLRNTGDPAASTLPENITFGAQLVNAWASAPFCNDAGQPQPLPRLASVGGDRSFDALVAKVSTDIRARVVLDEWLRLGIVRLDEKERVHLEAQAFVPQKGFDEKAAYLGHNLHDHACAAVHNLSSEGPAFFERSVHYDALAPMSVEALREAVASEGMQALLSFNRLAAELEFRDLPSLEPRQRITVGLYFYTEASDPNSPKAPES